MRRPFGTLSALNPDRMCKSSCHMTGEKLCWDINFWTWSFSSGRRRPTIVEFWSAQADHFDWAAFCGTFRWESEGQSLNSIHLRHSIVCYRYVNATSQVFHKLVSQDKSEHQGVSIYTGGPHINIQVRRNFLYEDAFERLSPDNGKLHI